LVQPPRSQIRIGAREFMMNRGLGSWEGLNGL
jgi:hypothetical protein